MHRKFYLSGYRSLFTSPAFVLNLVFLLAAVLAFIPASAQTTLNPTADTDTQNDNTSGTNTTIYASQYNHLLVRFDMATLSGTVTNAKLRMYQSGPSVAHTLSVNTTSTDVWNEGGTKPAVGSLIVNATGRTTAGWVEVDITAHIQTKMAGNKVVSLGLKSNIGTWTPFSSRQSATNKPELVVTTSSSALVEAKNTSVAVTVDGNLNESFWNTTTNVGKAINGTPNNSASFGVAWNSTYLYVGVRVTDAALYNDTPASPWEDDAVEIYIDANNNKGTTYDTYDRQIIKVHTSTGIWEQHNYTTGIVHATAAITGGYSAEVAIPWSNLGITAAEAVTIGFDIGINDDDNGGVRESQLLWNGTDDNWENTSAFGSLRLVAEGDLQAPSVPTGLAASNITQTTFRLSWTASTDNVGVTGYEVFKDGISAGTTTTATFMDLSGLTASTTYSMRVRARDAAGNWSAQSSALPATTSAASSGLVEANNTGVTVTVDGNLNESFWNINTSVAKPIIGTPNNSASYGVAWNGTYLYVGVTVTDAALYSDTPASPWQDDAVEIYIDANNNKGTTYDSYDRQIVKAYNASGIWEKNSNTTGILHATTAVTGGYSVEVAIPWSNLGITAGEAVTIGFDVGLNDDDNGGNRESQLLWNGDGNNWQNTAAFGSLRLVGGSDLQSPSIPTGLTASGVTQTSFRLSWTASTDNIGVTGYEVFKDGISAGTTSATFMDLTGLTASTTYSMTVRARDAAGNWSAQSNALPVTTSAAGAFANEDSPLGINLSDTRYWSNDWPFVNLAKSGEWRTTDWQQVAYSSLTSQGYLPVGTDGRFIVVGDTDTWPHGTGAGTYVFTYTGTATISLVGGGTIVTNVPGRMVINIPAGTMAYDLSFQITNHTAQLGNFRVTENSNENNPNLFRQSFLDQWKYFGWLRFMDWMHTNGSAVVTTAQYASDNTLLESRYGAHFSTMVELCNRLNANPWITIPHQANDAFVSSIANYFKNNLSPGLNIYVEYSNECWNFGFQQAHYCRDRGVALNLDPEQYTAGRKFYAKRSGEIHTIFESVFGVNSPRLVRLIAWQAASSWGCNDVLNHYNTYKGQEADALAVAPYFGGSLGGSTYAGEVVNWTLTKLLNHLDPAFPSQLNDGSNAGRLSQAQGWMTSDATVAQQHGVRLIAYEGGQHLVGVGTWMENTTLQNLFNNANRDSRMKGIHLSYLDMWKAVGGEEFAAFNSCGPFTKYGSWGAKERFTQTRTQAPKYDGLLTWIENNPGSFLFGGGGGGESMSSWNGTEEEEPAVHPNPSSERTSVTLKDHYRGKVQINLYSASNEKIKVAETEKLSDDLSIDINTSGFRKGIYLLEIQSGEKRTTRRLMIR